MMWTPTDSLLMALFLAAHLILFYASLGMANRFLKQASWFEAMGNHLFAAKEKQLRKNPLMRYFAKKVDEDQLSKGTLIIAALILVKSLGMAAMGFMGISLIVIPLQGMMMSAVFSEMSARGFDLVLIKAITYRQLSAMLALTTAGNIIGYRKWIEDQSLSSIPNSGIPVYLLLLVLAMISAVAAATREVQFFKENRSLIG